MGSHSAGVIKLFAFISQPQGRRERTRELVGCPETVILEKEREKRWVCKGPSELNADRRSAIMSGGWGRAELAIGKFAILRYIQIGSNQQQAPPIVTRPAGLQSTGCNRLGHKILPSHKNCEPRSTCQNLIKVHFSDPTTDRRSAVGLVGTGTKGESQARKKAIGSKNAKAREHA